jgi:hypothetical protein
VAEFALPSGAAGGEPETQSIAVVDNSTVIPAGPFVFWQFTGSDWYRVRAINVFGSVAGSAGTVTINVLSGGGPGGPPPFDFGIPWQAPSGVTIPVTKSFIFTWSADIGDNYSGLSQGFDVVGVFGLPLVWVPGGTGVELTADKSFGGDGVTTLDGGIMQYERVAAAPGSGGAANADLYLLPALG